MPVNQLFAHFFREFLNQLFKDEVREFHKYFSILIIIDFPLLFVFDDLKNKNLKFTSASSILASNSSLF